ncbi:MAG: biotin/lipoyl-containing protein [Candidatus Acidiferrales bacterium]
MKLEVRISRAGSQKPKTRSVELVREAGRLLLTLDGRPVEADAVEVAAGTYSILLSGKSFEVRVQPAADGVRVHTGGAEFSARVLDPRAWRGRRSGVLEAEGRQQVTAPMPGKVVRLLVKLGDAVEAGQGLLVVEAMKMQNEIRAPKTGKIEALLVAEGQAVNAGEVLAIVA